MNSNPRTIKTLSQREECLVIRFMDSDDRDKACVSLWNAYQNEPIHFEKRRSKRGGEVYYAQRGRARGEFLIVKAPTLCSDTWHCAEFEQLKQQFYCFGDDIDRVQYYEIEDISTQEPLSPQEHAEMIERQRQRAEANKRAEEIRERQREMEAEKRAETNKRAEEAKRVAEERKRNVQSNRETNRVCIMCGKSLGFFQKVSGVKQHKKCMTFTE